MEPDLREESTSLEDQVRHMQHPVKDGVLTIAGSEDCDIPELTAEFLFGGAEIEHSKVLDRN
jgi:hypothetical protein